MVLPSELVEVAVDARFDAHALLEVRLFPVDLRRIS